MLGNVTFFQNVITLIIIIIIFAIGMLPFILVWWWWKMRKLKRNIPTKLKGGIENGEEIEEGRGSGRDNSRGGRGRVGELGEDLRRIREEIRETRTSKGIDNGAGDSVVAEQRSDEVLSNDRDEVDKPKLSSNERNTKKDWPSFD